MSGQTDPAEQWSPSPGRTRGRHRNARSAAAPVTLGLVVTGLLATFGAAAALVPPSVIGAADTSPAGTAADGAGPTEAGPGDPPRSADAAPAGTGPDGTRTPGTGALSAGAPGPAAGGTGPNGTGPNGTAPDGTGPNGTGPNGTGPNGTGPNGTGRVPAGGTGPGGTGTGGTAVGIGPDGAVTVDAVQGRRSGSPTAGTTAPRTTAGTKRPGTTPAGDGTGTGAGDPGPAGAGASPPRADEAPRTTAGDDFAGLEDEVVTLTNVERRRNGCGDLTVSPALRTAMRLHVQEVAGHAGLYLSHVSDDGRSFADRARAQGYPDPGAENVARGQRSPADVVQGWMDSPGHRANIVNCGLKAIGVGVARGDGTLVWGQLFGRS